MQTIGELNHDRYTNHKDNFSLQQVSIASHVDVAIPFHAHLRTSIRRLQILVA